jgi:hypothetical protein
VRTLLTDAMAAAQESRRITFLGGAFYSSRFKAGAAHSPAYGFDPKIRIANRNLVVFASIHTFA